MLEELLQKLQGQHGIDPAQGHSILNTIAQHIKERFPAVGGMIDSALGLNSNATTNSGVPANTNVPNTGSGESSLQQLEDLAKSKLGGIFGGNL